MLILTNLNRVLLVDVGQFLHNMLVLLLHLRNFLSPLMTLLILLLPKKFFLLLNSLLFKLQHLNLIVDVSALHCTEF